MTCNNFLSVLSVRRQGMSPQQGKDCKDRQAGSWMQSKQMKADILCDVGSGTTIKSFGVVKEITAVGIRL